jgi:cold-inducible RNA-binding protein
MSTKVYVDNLAAAVTETDLIELFSPYGNVADANIATDSATRRSRGFGFVTMATPEGARSAIRALHGKAIGICILTVTDAWPREEGATSAATGRNPRPSPSSLYRYRASGRPM